MKTIGLYFGFCLLPILFYSQVPDPPAKQRNYSGVTTYVELSDYVQLLDEYSGLLKVEVIGQSVQGRDLYGMKFSSSSFGKDDSKVRVLIFAQQHGNEQSGKEGALLLAHKLLSEENRHLFERIDLMLIPQVNPDGSEVNKRRNANDADLNRNHLILTEPETQALHRVFDEYLFEVSLDVHEYSPYGEDWKEFGYRKNSEVTVGTTTNVNVSEEIRRLSRDGYLPFFFSHMDEKGFSSFEYCPGGPPDSNYIRHSTFDVNDGRQSLGIQNSFSFIQEGMNGTDSYIENLERRAEGQYAGMRCLLEYVCQNAEKIKLLVGQEREKLIQPVNKEKISIQSEHVSNGKKLEMPLFSYQTEKDTIIVIDDYRPVVRSLLDVEKPNGYLVPVNSVELTEWAERHDLENKGLKNPGKYRVEVYYIKRIESIDFEGDTIVDPVVVISDFEDFNSWDEYMYIPTDQLKGNMIVLGLEPKSMLGLVTYRQYAHMLKEQAYYPVLRVSNNR